MPQVIKSNTVPQSLNAQNDAFESSLRPCDFIDFVGQEKTFERLKIMTGAAKKCGEALSQILLNRPHGLGKITCAMILGQGMGNNIRLTSDPVIKKAGNLAGLLMSLEACDILFIDEIHRVPKTVDEYVYSVMEDFRIEIMIGQRLNARSVSLHLPPFTLVGATTRTDLFNASLRSKFTLQTRLHYYLHEILTKIITHSAKLLSIEINPDCANEIASRSRRTPRIANNLL
jgi:Holliday junction DNA helicase RuvB